MKSYKIKYGIIGGIVSSLLGTLNWLLIAKPLGVGVSQTVGYASIIISLMCIPLGIKYFRDNLNNGMVSFGEAMKIGFGITFIAGILMALHSIIFFALQKDEFIAWQRNSLSGDELEAFNQQMASMPDYVLSPLFQGVVMFLTVILIGIVINILSALILKSSTAP